MRTSTLQISGVGIIVFFGVQVFGGTSITWSLLGHGLLRLFYSRFLIWLWTGILGGWVVRSETGMMCYGERKSASWVLALWGVTLL